MAETGNTRQPKDGLLQNTWISDISRKSISGKWRIKTMPKFTSRLLNINNRESISPIGEV